jgi:hypothetical protein
MLVESRPFLANLRICEGFRLNVRNHTSVRDPHHQIVDEQLNGGEFTELTDEDWALIRPYLENNERFFGISVEDDLLTVDGVKKSPAEVYRKVRAVSLAVLAKAYVPE